MLSITSASTLGGWPPVHSRASTSEVNSWPSGMAAKRRLWAVPVRLRLKERGGMITKVLAAKRAARSGAHTGHRFWSRDGCTSAPVQGESIGTLLVTPALSLDARKQWLADHSQVTGKIDGTGSTRDLGEVADRASRALAEGTTISTTGKSVPIRVESFCVHSDLPNAVDVARTVRSEIERAAA